MSGNALQAPVDVPVNVCGNSVDVIAALNPAFGNACENASDEQTDGHESGHGSDGGYGNDDGGYGDDTSSSGSSSSSGSHADGTTEGSPGVGSGNSAQIPVDVPVNLCGNSIGVVSALNPVFGNKCENEAQEPPGYGEEEPPPPTHEEPPPPSEEKPPPPVHEEHTPPAPQTERPPALAETGSDGTLGAAAAGAVLIAGGAILYRRGRAAAGR